MGPGPLRAEPLSEPLGVDLVRRGLRAELGHDPAENPAVRPAGAGLLGAAQRDEAGLGGLAEGDVTGGRVRRRTVPMAGRYQR
jgi:hypothetical protein